MAMIIIRIFKKNAGYLASFTSAITFGDCEKRLRLYFPDLKKIKERITDGEIIDLPYLTLQKDRRVNKKVIRKERRKN